MTIWHAPATLRDVDGWPALMTGETPVAEDDICTHAAISANKLGEEANRWRVGFKDGARVGLAEGWTMPANGLVNGVMAYCAAQAAECLMHESSAVIVLGVFAAVRQAFTLLHASPTRCPVFRSHCCDAAKF